MFNRHLFNMLSCMLIIFCIERINATTYYVDFDNGNDSFSGTNQNSAWKHCPGDSSSTSNAASRILSPGDMIIFRGGVYYRGKIEVKSSGSKENPIHYIGNMWGQKKAIIDGSEVFNNTWVQCKTIQDANGNPNWNKIYFTQIPKISSPLKLNIFENNIKLYIAQYPNPREPYFPDDINSFLCPKEITQTYVIDSNLTLFGNNLIGTNIWTYQGNSSVKYHVIQQYAQAESKVTFEDIKSTPYTGNAARYALFNNVLFIDNPGEYSCSDNVNNDSNLIYLWPISSNPNSQNLTYSIRDYGINLRNSNNIVIDGFVVQKVSGDHWESGGGFGVAIGTINSNSSLKENIIIMNNDIVDNSYSEYSGYGGIYLSHGNNCIIKNNVISNNQFHCGIFIESCLNTTVNNNSIFKAGGTCLKVHTCKLSVIDKNIITYGHGSHSNGMSLYLGCDSIVVCRNIVIDSYAALTMSDSKNLFIFNNYFDGVNNNPVQFVVATWSGMSGINYLINNNIVGSKNHYSVTVTNGDFTFINNIFDGAGNKNAKHIYNLYVGLGWDQQKTDGWNPGEGDIIDSSNNKYLAINPLDIFKQTTLNIGDTSYTINIIKPSCRAVNSGINPLSYLPVSAFPNVDFTADLFGNTRSITDAKWDIGATTFTTVCNLTGLRKVSKIP